MPSENAARLRIIFMGTPMFAVPSLKMLLREGYDVCAVVTQPDREKGRGHKLLPPPVKVCAVEAGVPVFQFLSVSKEGAEALAGLGADLMVTAAYGQILSAKILAICPLGCINVHASLLPRYRGAAPIERALLAGESITGVSTMFTVRAVDAGDILEQDTVEISPEDTGGTLREKLAETGARTLKRTLEKLAAGTLIRTPQDPAQATYAPMFEKGFGQVDFTDTCRHIVDMVRAINPEPGAYALLDGRKLKLWFAAQTDKPPRAPGEIVLADPRAGLFVSAADGVVEIVCLQSPGAKKMSARDFLRGRGKGIKAGMRFSAGRGVD